MPEKAKCHAAACQEHQHNQGVDYEYCSREPLKTKLEENDSHADYRAGRHRFRKGHQIIDAGVTPNTAIHAKEKEGQQSDHNQYRQRPEKEFPGRTAGERFELNCVCGPVSQDDQDHVKQHLEDAPLVRKINQEGEQRLFARGGRLFFLIVTPDPGEIDTQ